MSHANAGRQDIAVIFQENVPGEACSLVFFVCRIKLCRMFSLFPTRCQYLYAFRLNIALPVAVMLCCRLCFRFFIVCALLYSFYPLIAACSIKFGELIN